MEEWTGWEANESYPNGNPWTVPSDPFEFRHFLDLGIKFSASRTMEG